MRHKNIGKCIFITNIETILPDYNKWSQERICVGFVWQTPVMLFCTSRCGKRKGEVAVVIEWMKKWGIFFMEPLSGLPKIHSLRELYFLYTFFFVFYKKTSMRKRTSFFHLAFRSRPTIRFTNKRIHHYYDENTFTSTCTQPGKYNNY